MDYLPLVLLLAAIAYLMLRNRAVPTGTGEQERMIRKQVKQGPVPGYSSLPGHLIVWDPAQQPCGEGQGWVAQRMETIHAGQRSRLVLTIEGEDCQATERFSLMKQLAMRLHRRTGAIVVAVRYLVRDERSMARDDTCNTVMIYASDGRGWTGTTEDATITVQLPGRVPFRIQYTGEPGLQ